MVAKIVVIVGETASGKSDLAMLLAKKFNGEIIAADSCTVYRHMDIGTAKPTPEDRKAVRHHLLDVVEPNEDYNVARFQADANAEILDISKRGKTPIVVGGSGLYVDALIYDYKFGGIDEELRKTLNGLELDELQSRATKIGIKEEEVNFKNRRHLQRAIEAGGVKKNDRRRLRDNVLVIGIARDSDDLDKRIRTRIDKMLEDGLVSEVEGLIKKYDEESSSFQTPAYSSFINYVKKTVTLDEAKDSFAQKDRQLAKKQRTWFKRNKSTQWIKTSPEAITLVAKCLQTKKSE